MSFFQISSCAMTHGGISRIIRIQVVPLHQRPLTAISLCSKRLRPIACMRPSCRRNCSRIRPCARRTSSSGEGMRTTLSALRFPSRYSLSRRHITCASSLSLTWCLPCSSQSYGVIT
jgi:hypothetical protein